VSARYRLRAKDGNPVKEKGDPLTSRRVWIDALGLGLIVALTARWYIVASSTDKAWTRILIVSAGSGVYSAVVVVQQYGVRPRGRAASSRAAIPLCPERRHIGLFPRHGYVPVCLWLWRVRAVSQYGL
jgi:hypothetical protein